MEHEKHSLEAQSLMQNIRAIEFHNNFYIFYQLLNVSYHAQINASTN